MTILALVYGSESWALKKREAHIQTTETKRLGGIKTCISHNHIYLYTGG